MEAACRLLPTERESWVRVACGEKEALRAEVGCSIDEAAEAECLGSLGPPERAGRGPQAGATAMSASGPRPDPDLAETVEFARPGPPSPSRGFTPRSVLTLGSGRAPMVGIIPPERIRLRTLAFLYLAIFGLLPIWRYLVHRETDRATSAVNAVAVVALGATVAFLSGRRPLSSARLQVLELGMAGLIAGVVAVIYYRAMLRYSLRGDVTSVQLVMKNFVLYAAVLIVTFGVATPKSRLRAALIAGPFALMPFVTLLVLWLGHPQAMGGLARWTTPLAHLSFDALFLVILAVGSIYQARAFYRLRRAAADARRLGHYRLREQIGAGGMGEVYLAEHHLLKRPCAVKLIRPEAVAEPGARARFEREVHITAALTHPNIVEVYDYGRADDGTYYYVMEYLPGLSLEELVERHGPLPPGRAVHLLRQVCRALSAAHAAGLIHRDIKPSNVIVAGTSGVEDLAKLVDFGLVLPPAGSRAPSLTREDQVLGTPLFMAPEQATSHGPSLDGRSDLYALGAVAYYLLTGRPPFEGEDGIGVMIAHARDPVERPSRLRPDIPEDLERVVLRGLAKAPADRFPDAESMEQALGNCICSRDWDQANAALWWRLEPASSWLSSSATV